MLLRKGKEKQKTTEIHEIIKITKGERKQKQYTKQETHGLHIGKSLRKDFY